jgi:hypothetical protein
MSYPQVILQARNDEIAKGIEDCADGRLNFGDLCQMVRAMGYKTTSLYEMVRAAESAQNPAHGSGSESQPIEKE